MRRTRLRRWPTTTSLAATNTLYWKGEDVAELLGIEERRNTRVDGIDADNREVVLANGERIRYEGLVIASGSRLHAPLEGADLPGILDFKSFGTAEKLVGRVGVAKRRAC